MCCNACCLDSGDVTSRGHGVIRFSTSLTRFSLASYVYLSLRRCVVYGTEWFPVANIPTEFGNQSSVNTSIVVLSMSMRVPDGMFLVYSTRWGSGSAIVVLLLLSSAKCRRLLGISQTCCGLVADRSCLDGQQRFTPSYVCHPMASLQALLSKRRMASTVQCCHWLQACASRWFIVAGKGPEEHTSREDGDTYFGCNWSIDRCITDNRITLGKGQQTRLELLKSS